ncbi:hypothetical protein BDA96_07G014400 [Sorghum bicolor]|uniref:Uncharacterized protein n=1 Tax=Sorghum bicolor TaxID=4558 RepID=A0A921U8F7_SORBI|nr:hypothetical protein BDA96_07G014400 [Sorghum bicolor]
MNFTLRIYAIDLKACFNLTMLPNMIGWCSFFFFPFFPQGLVFTLDSLWQQLRV